MRTRTKPKYDLEELKRLIIPVVSKYEVDRVFVFGSYARGDADGSSDIDLRIDADRLRTLTCAGSWSGWKELSERRWMSSRPIQ